MQKQTIIEKLTSEMRMLKHIAFTYSESQDWIEVCRVKQHLKHIVIIYIKCF